jgi:hypothetical protein
VTGTLIIGVTNTAASILPIFYVNKVGRRTILTVGHLVMAIALFVCGLSMLYAWKMTAFVTIVLSTIVF